METVTGWSGSSVDRGGAARFSPGDATARGCRGSVLE